MFITWDQIYTTLGIKDFIYFISSPTIQHTLFPVKIVFFFFTVVFLAAVIYFYVNSTYLQYKFLEDTTEFLSKNAAGLAKIDKSWKKIRKKMTSGNEADVKLAIIEADDFLYETLDDAGVEGNTFEELIDNSVKKAAVNVQEVLDAHAVRNSIVYDPNYKLDVAQAEKLMSVYENAVKSISLA